MAITRRHLLAATAAAAAAGSLGVGGLVMRWWDQPNDAPWRCLSQEEIDFLEAMADAMFPAGGTPPMAGADANAARFFDEVIAAMEPTQGKLLRLLFNALDASTMPTEGGIFSMLPVDERRAVIQEWLHAELAEYRMAAQSVLVLVGTAYTVHPDTAHYFGPMYGCRYGA